MSKRDYEISNQEMSNFYNDIFSKINCHFEIYNAISYSRRYFTGLIIYSFVLTGLIYGVPIFYRLKKPSIHLGYYVVFFVLITGIAFLILHFLYKKFRSISEKSLDRKTYLETLEEIKQVILGKSSDSLDVTIQRLMKELEEAASLNHRRTNFFAGIFLAGFTIIITSVTALGDSYIKDTLAWSSMLLGGFVLFILGLIYNGLKKMPIGSEYEYSKMRDILNDIVYYYGHDPKLTLNRYGKRSKTFSLNASTSEKSEQGQVDPDKVNNGMKYRLFYRCKKNDADVVLNILWGLYSHKISQTKKTIKVLWGLIEYAIPTEQKKETK